MNMNFGDTVGAIGSILGLPEMRISEMLGGFDARKSGYNYGNNRTPASDATMARLDRGDNKTAVLGANGQVYQPGSTPTQTTNTTQTVAGANTGPTVDPNAAFLRAIEDTFNSRMGYLNQAEGTLRGQMPGIEQGIQDQYSTSRNTLQSEKGLSDTQINNQQTAGEQRKEDALSSARRLYNELITGGQQRFGGASSAGEAYQALSGRELQRNNATIQQDFGNFMTQISTAKNTLNERFNQGLQQLEMQKNSALDNARREFQNKLLEISRMKAGAEEDKANRRLEALQTLRNQTFEINSAIAQLNGNLNSMKQQAESELQNAITTFGQQSAASQQAGNQFGESTTTNPSTDLTIGLNPGTNMAANYTGIRRPEDDQALTGALTPRKDLFSNFAFA